MIRQGTAPEPRKAMPPTSRRWTARRSGWRISGCRHRPGTTSCLELGDPDQAARVAAVPKVGSLAPRAAIELLSGVFLNEDDNTVRSRAVAALTRLKGPSARGLLRERALKDDDAGLRMQALNALAALSGERAINVIGQALRQDPELEVRVSAIRALGRVGGDWARRYLERAVMDLDPEIGLAAEQTLAAWPDSAR